MMKQINVFCDETIMIFVLNTKMSNEQIMNVIQSMYDEYDFIEIENKHVYQTSIEYFLQKYDVVKCMLFDKFQMYVLHV